MKANETAVVLIGFQRDYFSKDGVLRSVIEESAETNQVLKNTLALLRELVDTEVELIQTPIHFSSDYAEMKSPIGLLKAINELGAFRKGAPGAAPIPQVSDFGDRIREVKGKDGFNAFSNTGLGSVLVEGGVRNVVLAGAVTSICIDSTGRSAHEKGYDVTVLSDCTCGRTNFEQKFYCEQILPLYANVTTSTELLADLS